MLSIELSQLGTWERMINALILENSPYDLLCSMKELTIHLLVHKC